MSGLSVCCKMIYLQQVPDNSLEIPVRCFANGSPRERWKGENSMTGKEKKIFIAEAVIVFVLLAAVLLTQLIGTVEIAQRRGEWRTVEDLNGRIIGTAADSVWTEEALELWPDSVFRGANSVADLPKMTVDGIIDAFMVSESEVADILLAYPELTAMLRDISSLSEITSAQSKPYIIIRAADYAYLSTKRTLDDLKAPGFRIAAITGSEMSYYPAKIYPECEIVNFNSFTDMFLALETGKADAVAAYYTQLPMVSTNYGDLAYISTPLTDVTYGFGTRKDAEGDRLRQEFNSYLREITASGELRGMLQKWGTISPDADASLHYTYTGEKGELRIATPGTWFPKTYYSGSHLTGQFIELLCDFCSRSGYIPRFECCDYAAEVAGLNSGTYDFMADTLYITEERMKQINITDPVTSSDLYIVVKNPPDTESVSKASQFFSRIRDGFFSNFVREERWKMLLNGLGITLILALLSGIIGTLLGALICRMKMSRSHFAQAFARIYIRVIQGIPITVLLMVLYYVIFSSQGMTALQICVIGFSVDFAAYAAEIFRNGIEAVPAGQARAARALGFTPSQGFFRVVLPQAMRHILPVYSGQLISMVKATSIAGYISVMELTKVSDIIRSRTFDAFFPLITTALIYFLLSNMLTGLMKLAAGRIQNRSASRALRGIQTDAVPEVQTVPREAPAAAAGQKLLEIEHLSKQFDQVMPLKDVSCVVSAGDVISVIGPSGTGKSTFLNLINRLETPDGGRILFNGEDTSAPGYNLNLLRRHIGMVFQNFNLFQHLTIVENVMLAQTVLLKRSRRKAYERSMELLRTVGLADKAFSYPAELSGGQQQRAAIARTIAMDPRIVLFDEPTSALDPTMVEEVLAVIRNLAQHGTTMLVVTHEMKFAQNVSNCVFYMDEGVIYEEGSPDQLFENPQKDRTRQFIRRLKTLTLAIGEEERNFGPLIADIDAFAQKNMVPWKLQHGMLTVLEELCIEQILAKQKHFGKIALAFEYAKANEEIRFRVSFGGEAWNPLSGDPSTAVLLLQHIITDPVFSRDENGNHVEGFIR